MKAGVSSYCFNALLSEGRTTLSEVIEFVGNETEADCFEPLTRFWQEGRDVNEQAAEAKAQLDAVGLAVSVVTILFASIRIARVNIIQAVRHITVPPRPRPRRRMVWVGAVAVVAGVALTMVGFTAPNQYGVMAGPMRQTAVNRTRPDTPTARRSGGFTIRPREPGGRRRRREDPRPGCPRARPRRR